MARMLLLAFLAFLAAASSPSSYSSAPLALSFAPHGLRPAEYHFHQRPAFALEPPPSSSSSTVLSARAGSGDDEKDKSTPAERHREAVAASQLEARKRRGEETTTPAERHRAVAAASQAAARLKRGEGTPAEKHGQAVEASRERARRDREERQAAAKSAFDDITSGLAESFVSTAKAFAKTDDDSAYIDVDVDELPQSKDVDAGQLNKLLVHAEKILADNDAAIELLGGAPTASLPDCRVLSRGPSQIMGVGGGRGKSTEGIRAFLEIKGPTRSGMATVVGDKRGVLLMKLTVGGQTLELKSTEGLNEAAAHGTVKTTSTKKKKGGPWP